MEKLEKWKNWKLAGGNDAASPHLGITHAELNQSPLVGDANPESYGVDANLVLDS